MLARLYGGGVPLGEQHKQALRIAGIGLDGHTSEHKSASTIGSDGRQHLWLYQEQAKKARERKNDPQEKAESYYDRIPKKWIDKWKDERITKEDWAPERVDKHDEEFRRFIKSHIPRFDKIIAYEKFYLYVEQARRWLAEGKSVETFSGEEQEQYALQEMSRIYENRLYGMDKYGWIKDDALAGGKREYKASCPQALIAFLLDSGYSLEIGKGRQAAITSTVMLYEVMTMVTRPSYNGVLVTDDVDFTGKAIFNDKLKASALYLREYTRWLYPPAAPGWADKHILFDWSQATSKDEKKLWSSKYSVAASDDTQTINGTTPSKIVFDETQNIPTYTAIKLEARPTMLTTTADDDIQIRRQIVAYGTGSSHQRGKGAFENEYKGTIQKFFEGKDTSSFVPMFLDWTCRPNMTFDRYRTEFMFYLANNEGEMSGLSKEERTAQFHAAYPSRVEDMFLTSHRTIIPQILIKKHQDRIYEKCTMQGYEPKRGKFEPVFDMSKPQPQGSYLPYFVSGARWKEAPADDLDQPILMLVEPERGWTKRYTRGTDPIQSPTGNSKFASLILDRAGRMFEQDGQKMYQPIVPCIMNWKNEIVEENFLQSVLMGMYYANYGQRACMEVFEINQGQSYERFCASPFLNLANSQINRMALPHRYQGGGHYKGLGLKSGSAGGTKSALYHDVRNGLLDMGDGIWYNEIFHQANNVIVEERREKSGLTGMAYYPRNKNVDNDDLLDAFGFALIASEVEAGMPAKIDTPDAPLRRKQIVHDHDPRTLEYIEREIEVPVKY